MPSSACQVRCIRSWDSKDRGFRSLRLLSPLANLDMIDDGYSEATAAYDFVHYASRESVA